MKTRLEKAVIAADVAASRHMVSLTVLVFSFTICT